MLRISSAAKLCISFTTQPISPPRTRATKRAAVAPGQLPLEEEILFNVRRGQHQADRQSSAEPASLRSSSEG
jgi:hypothetical protein